MSIFGGMLGGAATGAGTGAMVGGPWGAVAGAGIGAVAGGYMSAEQQRAEEKKYKRQNSLYAKNIELSPWIGMSAQAPQESMAPSGMQQAMGGVAAGAQMYGAGKQANANELLAKQQSELNQAQINYLQGANANKLQPPQAMNTGYVDPRMKYANGNPWMMG